MNRASEAIIIRAYGGPDVMRLEPISVAAPGHGELLVRQQAASVNFHDIYVRSGSYRTLDLPGIPGLEAVGTVESIGEGVTDLRQGSPNGCIFKGLQPLVRMGLFFCGKGDSI
jgi:NADPH2:quinone reductase